MLLLVTTSTSAIANEPQQQGDITYVTGGIGERETESLRSERGKYALRIVNAGAKGAFTGNTHITLLDKEGFELLDVDGGPLLYANLPAGKYTVIAKSEKRTQVKSITIASGKPVDDGRGEQVRGFESRHSHHF